MHLAQSRLRAIETSLPVVRAANTGISAVINTKGEVKKCLEPLIKGYITADVTLGEAHSSEIASRAFVLLCALYIFALPIADIVVPKKNKE
jgi:apolipoprotein N-acyltransferase